MQKKAGLAIQYLCMALILTLVGGCKSAMKQEEDKKDINKDSMPPHAIEFPGIPGKQESGDISELSGTGDFIPSFKMVNFSPGPEYSDRYRKRAGEPTLERAPNGRLWAAWSSGPVHEDRYRYIITATSGDDGKTWNVVYVIDKDADGPYMLASTCLWLDPEGKLWHFWWQTTFEGPVPAPLTEKKRNQQVSRWKMASGSLAMAMTTENPESSRPIWSKPKIIARGQTFNKPIVNKNGEWMLPTAIWPHDNSILINVSTDKGKTWTLRGTANIPQHRRNADEPMIVERNDGSLWLLARTLYGIGESVSTDGGYTWTEVADWQRMTPARFHIRRLVSGNLLLVRHGTINQRTKGRTNLMAFLSDDDGETWRGGLVLDNRGAKEQQGSGVSYPDGTQAPDGRIYIIHDYNRWNEKEITMHVFTEEDVLAGHFQSQKARQKVLVNKATGINLRHAREFTGYHQRNKAQEGLLKAEERFPPRSVDAGAAAFRFGPRAAFETTQGEIRTLHDAVQIFSNRPWLVQELPRRDIWDPFHPGRWPDEFAGFGGNMDFIFSPFGQTTATCVKKGMAYVFTPAPARSNKSVEKELLDQGFKKTSEPEFYLFVTPPVKKPSPKQAATVYQKEVKIGEQIKFGQWGVLVF